MTKRSEAALVCSDMNIPNFEDAPAYERIRLMSQGQIRWEFLRRSSAYRLRWDHLQRIVRQPKLTSLAEQKTQKLKALFRVQHLFSPRLSADPSLPFKLHGGDRYVWHGLEQGSQLHESEFDHLFSVVEVFSHHDATDPIWMQEHRKWIFLAVDPTLKQSEVFKKIKHVLEDRKIELGDPTYNAKNRDDAVTQLRVLDGSLQGYSHGQIARLMSKSAYSKTFTEGERPMEYKVTDSMKAALQTIENYTGIKILKPASGKWALRYYPLRYHPS